ncbi:MAG: bifunctional nuclease family protein [Nitrososphaeria archaeon]|jgi:bifunctional DNase/RNase
MFVEVKITNVGILDESGSEGFIEFTSDDGRKVLMGSFSGEVSYHIMRFMQGDRKSLPTVYNMIEELANYMGLELEKVEIYPRGNVFRANIYFIGRNGKKLVLENYRASDAVALAVFYNMPIYIDETLLS